MLVKLLLLPLLLLAACLTAGLYGAVHNQISYTVAPEYFHAFKFDQFDIPTSLHGRLGAAIVGWYASWWMGAVVGLPVLLVGLILPGWQAYLGRCMVAFVVVILTTLIIGLGGLLYAWLSITPATLPPFYYPAAVQDRVAFARAAMMHNCSYLGGSVGILTGMAYLVITRFRNRS